MAHSCSEATVCTRCNTSLWVSTEVTHVGAFERTTLSSLRSCCRCRKTASGLMEEEEQRRTPVPSTAHVGCCAACGIKMFVTSKSLSSLPT